jgi:phosphatidylserine/phosphatidylglycerophosphate/cardiolipin synthase-like enzyme
VARSFLIAVVLLAIGPGCALYRRCFESEPAPESQVPLQVIEAPHRAVILDDGRQALAARVQLIRMARHEIRLQTFIWDQDDVGRLLALELIEAARRGVHVRLLVDQMFSVQDAAVVAAVAASDPNLELRHYNPIVNRIQPGVLASLGEAALDFRSVNHRMHNKILAVDGRWVITGGRNIQNSYFGCSTGMNYRDRDVLVEGAVVERIERSFDDYWDCPLAVRSADLVDVGELLRTGRHPTIVEDRGFDVSRIEADLAPLLSSPEPSEQKLFAHALPVGRVGFVVDRPGKNAGDALDQSGVATEQCRTLVAAARHRVLVQSPYCVLSDRTLRQVERMREATPDLLLQVSTNSLAATDAWYAYAAQYRQKRALIESLGVQVFEFKPLPGDLESMLPEYAELRRRRAADDGVDPASLPPVGDETGLGRVPYLCLHAKSFVIDDEVSIVGSLNVDPHSANLNTEAMLVLYDADFSRALTASIERDTAPRNSWVVWRSHRPLGVEQALSLVEGVNALGAAVTGLDLWPSTSTSAFELIDGEQPVPVTDPDFYEHYREVGNFPWVDVTDSKLVLARLFKAVLAEPLQPIL